MEHNFLQFLQCKFRESGEFTAIVGYSERFEWVFGIILKSRYGEYIKVIAFMIYSLLVEIG